MINISSVEKICLGGKTRISCNVQIDGVSYPLWYEVDSEFGHVLCAERSDAFVAGLLLYAIRRREDISFVTPMTNEMKKSIEQDFLLAVCDHDKDVYPVKLFGPTAAAIVKPQVARLTGISCGADSLYTVIRRMVKESDKEGPDYLAIFNHHGTVGRPGEESKSEKQERFRMVVERARRFSRETGLPLIVGDTNYNSGEIPGLMSEGNATFVNMFCALSMQNFFTHYLIASAGGVSEFGYYLRQGFNQTIHENYDLLTTAAFSTRAMRITIDGLVTRDEKMRYLADEPLAQKYLDVCHVHQIGLTKNGTNDCAKCMRTVLELLILGPGVLDRFAQVFDVEYVYSHKYVYLAEMMRGMLRKSLFAQQCWGRRKVVGFTYVDYVRAMQIVVRKMIGKLLRGGKTGYRFTADGR